MALGLVNCLETSSNGTTGWCVCASTSALNWRRSSRRRSCQKARLTITTTRATTSRWKAIHLGRSRKPYVDVRRCVEAAGSVGISEAGYLRVDDTRGADRYVVELGVGCGCASHRL